MKACNFVGSDSDILCYDNVQTCRVR